jgi:hypothetical protein
MHSLYPVYDLSAVVPVAGVSLNHSVPVIEVRDVDAPPYGVAHLETQGAIRRGGDIVICHDEWVPLVTPISRVRCGELLVSYVLHEGDAREQGVGRDRIVVHDNEAVVLINISVQTGEMLFEDKITQTDEFPRFLADENWFNIDDEMDSILALGEGVAMECPTRLSGKYVKYTDYDWQ